MKNLFLLLILLSVKGCSQTKDLLIVEYEAISRGYFYKASVSEQEITTAKDQSGENISKETCTEEQWKQIILLLDDINISDIDSYLPPSEERARDAAAHATLTIKRNEDVYKSRRFDSGNPPKELEPLVKAILTLAKTVEKE